MIGLDEDNYKEAIDASFKLFAPHGISKCLLLYHPYNLLPCNICSKRFFFFLFYKEICDTLDMRVIWY